MSQRRLRAPFRITLVYVLLTSLWFCLADFLLSVQAGFPAQFILLLILRDIAFVTVSAGGLYLIVRREFTLRAETESRLENILATAADAIITIDDQQQIQLFNQAAEHLFGYRAAEIIGQPIDCLIPNETQSVHRQHIEQFALAPDIRRAMHDRREVIGQRRDGSRFTAEAGISKLDRPGRRSFTVIIRDVTQRQAAETALRASESRLCVLVEQIPAVLWITDTDLRFTFAAGAGLTALKIRPEQVVGQRIEAFSPPDDPGLAEVVAMHRRALQGESVNYESDRRGRIFQNHVEPFRTEDNRISGCLGLALDITDQKRVEAALQESEARYRSIIEAMNEGVVFQDAAGHILTCNASAERILGVSLDQLAGRTSLDPRWHTLHEDGTPFPGSDHPAMVTLRTGQPQSNVIMGVGKPDDTLTWITINAQPLFHAGDDRPYAVVVTFGDITERKRAEQALQLAEARYRARLEERVAQRTRELALLLNISHRLSTTLELKPLLGLILDQVRSIIAYDFGLIFALNGSGDDTAAYAIRRDGPPPPMVARRPLGIEQLRPILEVGTAPINAPDVTGDSPEAQLFQRTVAACLGEAAVSIRAWLWTPLVVNNQLIGGLSLAHSAPQRYAENQVGLLTTIANQAAIAIENARLYGEARALAALQERQRLARELHDSVTQQLFSASLIAEVLPQLYEQNQTEGREYLDDVRRLTRGALAEMRALLMELRPAALHEAALIELVRQLAEAFTGRTRVPVQFDLDGEPAPPSDVKIAVYRIVQEALNNSAKHAKARHVIIQLCGDHQALELQIADDGRGFDRAQVRSDRLGLTIMRERAQAIGAALSIESEPDRGTTIRLIWPTAPAQSKE